MALFRVYGSDFLPAKISVGQRTACNKQGIFFDLLWRRALKPGMRFDKTGNHFRTGLIIAQTLNFRRGAGYFAKFFFFNFPFCPATLTFASRIEKSGTKFRTHG